MRPQHHHCRLFLAAIAGIASATVALADRAEAEDPPQPLAAGTLADELTATSLMEIGGNMPSALRVLDLRPPVEWRNGHVPGAVNLPTTGQDRERLAEKLRRLGIGEDARVVLYGGVTAELYHALERLGVSSVAVLDGGIAAWRAGGYPIATAPVS